MGTPKLTVFTQEYAGRAKPKQAYFDYDDREKEKRALNKIKRCHTCRRRFREGDAIAITRTNLTVRRHASCAIEKKILSRSEARAHLRKLFKSTHLKLPSGLVKIALASLEKG